MKIILEVPDYDGEALDVIWENGANYKIDVSSNEIVLSANQQGLISLAKQMLYMAHNDLLIGSHVHYDSFFTKLNTSKFNLLIERQEECT